MRETKLSDRLTTKVKTWGVCSRVENAVEPGMPDIFYCIEGKTGWIETKVMHNDGFIYFEKFQLPWMRRYLRAEMPRLFLVVATSDTEMLVFSDMKAFLELPAEPYRKWTRMRVLSIPVIGSYFNRPYNWLTFKSMLIMPQGRELMELAI